MEKALLKDKIPLIKPLILENSEKDIVKKIYLFGSYAYGEPKESSDVDLCIIVDDNVKGLDYYGKIAMLLFDNGIKPCDLLMWRESDVYKASFSNPKGIENTILEEGILLYG